MKGNLRHSLLFESLKEFQSAFPSMFYIILLPFVANRPSLVGGWVITSFLLCIISLIISVCIKGERSYSFKNARLINISLLFLLIYQIIILARSHIAFNYMYLLLFAVYISLMIIFICAASINKPVTVILVLLLLIVTIVYLSNRIIAIIVTLLLFPIIDWISDGRKEAISSKKIRLALTIEELINIPVINFISNNPKFTKMIAGIIGISWFIISGTTEYIDSTFLNNWIEKNYILTKFYTFLSITVIYLIIVSSLFFYVKKKYIKNR